MFRQIYGVWVALIISLIGLGLVVWTVEPQAASSQVKTLFFITIFILVWSVTTIITFFIKKRLVKSRTLSEAAYEPIFYDSFLTGLFVSTVLAVTILIKKIINF